MKFLHTFSKCGLLMAVLLLFGTAALAQRTVKGKVTDAESGEGLIGATVSVVGTTRGASTDIDGNYSVEVPEGSTQLRFAYTGYAEQVFALTASNVVEIAMKPGSVLDEIVVVGYGTVKSKEVTSAVASLKKEDFNKGNISSASQLIQGKIAGVSVSRAGSDPNGEFSIRLRGLSSLSNAAPLIVVDGIPGVSTSLIDPNDIETFDVLKDGSAAAIYGTRASAGVVLITTKRGSVGRTVVDYNAFVAVDQVSRRYKVLSAADFVATGGTDFTPADGPGGTDTDWFDAITQTGVSQVHNLSLSGGVGNGGYRASFNFRDVDGILKNTGFKRYNGGLNFYQKALNNRLNINGNLAITTGDGDLGFPEAFRYAVIQNPTSAITTTDPTNVNGGYVENTSFDFFNPVAIINQNTNTAKFNRLLGSARAEYTIIDGLVAGVTVAQERYSFDNTEFYSKQSKYRGAGRNGAGIQNTASGVTNTLEATGEYTLKFAQSSSFKLLGGYSFQQFDNQGFRVDAGNIISNEFGANNLGAFLENTRGLSSISSYKNENRLIAFFGRATLNFNDAYFVSGGVRREGSTRFGPNNKWGLFPFISAGADFVKIAGLTSFNQLKLRVGYGVTGTQPDRNSLYRRTYNQGAKFFYNGNFVPSYGPTQNPNPDLKWEEKGEFDIGADFAFDQYKFSGSVDYYNRLTKGLIVALTVPQPPNFAKTTYANVASIRVNGFEAAINANDVLNGDKFKWSPGLVFSTSKGTLEDFNETGDTLKYANAGAPGQNDVYYTILYNGATLGQLWGPVREGVDGDGKIIYKDINGDGVVTKGSIEQVNGDQTLIGNGTPKFEIGFNNTFVMGNFDLNFLLRGVFGHDLVNEYRVFYENNDPGVTTWNKIDTKYYDKNLKGASRFDNTHVEDATFVRLDNATLGYNFSLPTSSWFTKARVYISGQNLFTITKYSGVDPEQRVGDSGAVDNGNRTSGSLDPLAPGIDRRSTYFLARTVSFGINFGF